MSDEKNEIMQAKMPENTQHAHENCNCMGNTLKPEYYGKTIDVIDFCLSIGIPFCEGNVIKYVVRYTKKGGIEDLCKAKNYLDRLINNLMEEGKK